MRTTPWMQNPHLEGGAFLLKGGAVGVLLIHGFTATTAEVRPLANLLHEAGYTVSAPLLPGHNTTPQDLNRATWQDWVATVTAAYHALASACSQVFVGGESTGGLLSFYLASQFPEISGVLGYAPALRLSFPTSTIIKIYAFSPFVPIFPKQHTDDSMPWQGYTVYPLKAVIQLLRLQKVVRRELVKIHQPLLIIQGRLDRTVHPTVPGEIARAVSSNDITIRWIAVSPHVVVLGEEMQSVGEISLDFIHRIISSTSSAS